MDGKKIVVLGAGLVGGAIAIDLNKKFDVTSVDIDGEALLKLNEKHNIRTITADLSDSEPTKFDMYKYSFEQAARSFRFE